jgi:3D-(3,5/4)-trihydroxycyclohexane-1,2-dione acylhydrolase (decyclizing)
MRVLTDPAETGAVTLALPQDVQAEAYDWPEEFLAERVWRVPRALPDEIALAEAAAAIRAARRPLVVSGGGTIYSEATEALRRFCEQTGIPVGETQAGKGSLPYDHPSNLGAIGVTGTFAANRVAAEADLVLGVGTRYSDFTTASKTAFGNPDVRFVNLNVAEFVAAKHSGIPLVGDARATLERLTELLAGHAVADEYRAGAAQLAREWDAEVARLYAVDHDPLAQSAVIGAVNDAARPQDVVVCAAGSMPGDLHKLWRTRDPKGYHVEYGFSCMGYELAGGLGVKLAAPEREVYVLVGDGSYLMLPGELVTAVELGVKLTVVLVDSGGYKSIGALSRSLGTDGFGTQRELQLDLAANAASLGAHVLRADTLGELRDAIEAAKAETRTTVIAVTVDREEAVPGYESWWDVPVAEVAEAGPVREARAGYDEARGAERRFL